MVSAAPTTTAAAAPARSRSRNTPWARFRRHRLALLGAAILAFFLLAATFAPLVAGHDPNRGDLDQLRAPPSASHILGTDSAGRDVWARLVFGARISMTVGLVAVLIAGLIGTVIGIQAGYFGGWVDNLLMRFTEVVMTFPVLFGVIVLVALVGPNLFNVILVIGVLGWPGLARLVRGQVLSLREMDYVTAARAVGATDSRILGRHILPGVMPYIMVASTLGVASAILTEAALSFLGLGVQIPISTWGNMLYSAQSLTVLQSMPWLWIPPGAAIAVTVMAVNFLGDGLRDALDPRIRID
ncbi:MAG: ABC transporter permease [Chloroflexi bacterium]|nr:ABC transporter permease [Chloroflexota bacterium]